MKKALIIKSGAIGDLISVSPLIKEYKVLNPTESITLLCGKSCAHVLSPHPYLDGIITFNDDSLYNDSFTTKVAETIKISRKISGFDKCFILHIDQRWELLADFAGIKEKYIVSREIENHQESYKRCLGLSGNLKSVFYPDSEYSVPFENYICIAPGGARNIKNDDQCRRWAGFPTLVKRLLSETDFNIVILGNEKDNLNINNERIINLCGKTTLSEAYHIICKANLFIGNDSGLLHLASCTQTNSIGIFTATSPAVAFPLNTNIIPFTSRLNCSPCESYGNFSTDCNLKCTTSITPDNIIKITKSLSDF